MRRGCFLPILLPFRLADPRASCSPSELVPPLFRPKLCSLCPWVALMEFLVWLRSVRTSFHLHDTGHCTASPSHLPGPTTHSELSCLFECKNAWTTYGNGRCTVGNRQFTSPARKLNSPFLPSQWGMRANLGMTVYRSDNGFCICNTLLVWEHCQTITSLQLCMR